MCSECVKGYGKSTAGICRKLWFDNIEAAVIVNLILIFLFMSAVIRYKNYSYDVIRDGVSVNPVVLW